MSIRILLVDDFERWRRLVCSILQEEPELQIICEVSDGLAAVQSAKELKPDLILLDLGLPKLNGMAAARMIRQIAPTSKILFLSQESSADVAQEALVIGAGFVVKADASKALIPAIKAVILGKQFLSWRLADHTFSGATDAQISAGLQ
jgi:DNA-binding NarL/FixJ family response regulator